MRDELSSEEYHMLIDKVKDAIRAELFGTIPPSIDFMRQIKFHDAAKRAVDLCLEEFAK